LSTPRLDESAELALELSCALGESPIWDARTEELVFVDIPPGDVYWWSPATARPRRARLGQSVSAIAPLAWGGYVLATRSGFAVLDEGGDLELVAAVEPDRPGNLMNDGKCDPRGRFWAGTMSATEEPGAGSLYRLELDGSVTKVVAGVTVSNGLDWSGDGKTMYYVDSLARGLDAFDFSMETGDVTARRRVADIPASSGVPDGICVDEEDYIWVALYSGHAVHRYSPEGVLDARVELPVALVTSCTFGGPDLRDLYITTAGAPGSNEPLAGSVFCYKAAVPGRPRRQCELRVTPPAERTR
jgi:sugar lactone lactonase YvrE